MAEDREKRRRLRELSNNVRAFFEVTSVAEGGRGWSNAFRAVRQNDYMADSFLAELRALIDFIEVELDPADGRAKARVEPTTAELPAERTPTSAFHSAETRILDRSRANAIAREPSTAKVPALKPEPPRPAPKPAAAKPAPRPEPKPAPKPAPAAARPARVPPPPPPPRRQFIDGATSVDTEPGFAGDDATGQMAMPPVHHTPPPKRKR